jgi:hypothetical protein
MNTRAAFAMAGSVWLAALATALPGSDRTLFRDRTTLHGAGKSMLPTFPESCRLVVVRVPFAEVRVGLADGDVISTRYHGRNIVHRAVRRLPDGSLVTWGDNNLSPDRETTTETNYVGVVVAYEHPATPGETKAPAARDPRGAAQGTAATMADASSRFRG